ncbi:hypothetical protein OQA88_1494 [Cercophora sp. LCS_1]
MPSSNGCSRGVSILIFALQCVPIALALAPLIFMTVAPPSALLILFGLATSLFRFVRAIDGPVTVFVVVAAVIFVPAHHLIRLIRDRSIPKAKVLYTAYKEAREELVGERRTVNDLLDRPESLEECERYCLDPCLFFSEEEIEVMARRRRGN